MQFTGFDLYSDPQRLRVRCRRCGWLAYAAHGPALVRTMRDHVEAFHGGDWNWSVLDDFERSV